MIDIELDISVTDEVIETEVLLNDDSVEIDVTMDTTVSVNPNPDLAYGGSSFIQ